MECTNNLKYIYEEHYPYSNLLNRSKKDGFSPDEQKRFLDLNFVGPAIAHLFMCQIIVLSVFDNLIQYTSFDGRDSEEIKIMVCDFIDIKDKEIKKTFFILHYNNHFDPIYVKDTKKQNNISFIDNTELHPFADIIM